MNSPGVTMVGSDLVVQVSVSVSTVVVDAVVDLADDGSVLGVEVIGLANLVGELGSVQGAPGIDVSVDAEADAVYLRFAQGRSVDQKVCVAAVAVDQGLIAAVRVRLEEESSMY